MTNSFDPTTPPPAEHPLCEYILLACERYGVPQDICDQITDLLEQAIAQYTPGQSRCCWHSTCTQYSDNITGLCRGHQASYGLLVDQRARAAEQRNADHVDGYDRDDLGESPDY